MKITLKKALALAKGEGYTGPETLEAVREYFEKNLDVRGDDGQPVTIVTKGITLTISNNEGPADSVAIEDATAPMEAAMYEDEEGAEPAEKSRTGQGDRQTEARKARSEKGFYAASTDSNKSVLNSPEGLARQAMRKAYSRKASRGETYFDSPDEAEMLSSWFRQITAKKLGGLHYENESWDRQVCQKAGFTIQNSPGGALVPSVFEPTLVKNREPYGTAERLVGTTTMTSMSEVRPVRNDWVTISAHTENEAIAESTPDYRNIELTAKEWSAITYLPISLVLTSAIDIEGEVFDEFQYAFAKKIDQVVFSGDGTAASFGISGFRTKLLAVDGTIGNIAGLAVASGNLFSEYTLADFQSAYGILPEYAEDNAQWVTHKKAYSATALRSALAAGGVFANEVNAYGGEKVKTFLDYPVNFVQNMPSADANSQIAHLLGNFPRAAKIGLVAGSLALDTDSSYRFGNGQIAYRMIQHVAVNVHDVGSTTEAGPVVGIISAAS